LSATATASLPTALVKAGERGPSAPGALSALGTLVGRRVALSAHTPREVMVPLLGPVMFALVIAPALAKIGPKVPGVDYMSFVAIGIAGLLIPLSCMFAGIGVMVDRESGARRDLLAAPIARPLVVVANVAVALLVTALQIVVLIVAVVLRGAQLHASANGILWFAAGAMLLAVAMYGAAEALANRIPSLEEYTGAIPPVAIVPFFFAGSLFPIGALPGFLTAFARCLPLTHAVALMRYGLLRNASGLHDIWGMTNASAMAALSVAVVAAAGTLLTYLAVRSFTAASRA